MRNYITTNELIQLLRLLEVPRTKQRLYKYRQDGRLSWIDAGKIKLYPVEEVERLVKMLKNTEFIQEDYENAFRFIVSYSKKPIDESTKP